MTGEYVINSREGPAHIATAEGLACDTDRAPDAIVAGDIGDVWELCTICKARTNPTSEDLLKDIGHITGIEIDVETQSRPYWTNSELSEMAGWILDHRGGDQ